MKHLIPLFRIDKIAKWQKSREKVWMDAEDHYEQLLGKMAKNNRHLVYLCSPLKPTEQKSIQDHVSQAILAASQILGGVTKCTGKKIAVFVPHLHLFSVYNEIIYPQVRERAIRFNNHLIQEYFHTLAVLGNTISGGMAAEIELARRKGIEVAKMGGFKKQLRNLPDLEESRISYWKMINLHNKMHGSEFWIEK